MSRVLYGTYALLLVNFLVYLVAIVSYSKASTTSSTDTTIFSTTTSSNAFAYMASIDVLACWFLVLNSQWLQWTIFRQTIRDNLWCHQVLAYASLCGYIFHGMFFMINGSTDFNQLTDKPTSGLASWLTFNVMFIAFFVCEAKYIVHIHWLLVLFFLFSCMHSYILIGLFIPFVIITIYLRWRQPSKQTASIVDYTTTDMYTKLTVAFEKKQNLKDLPLASFYIVTIPSVSKNGHELYAAVDADGTTKKNRYNRLHFYIMAGNGWSLDVYNLANEENEHQERLAMLEQRLTSYETKLKHLFEHSCLPASSHTTRKNHNHSVPVILTAVEMEYVEKQLKTRIHTTRAKIKKTKHELDKITQLKVSDPLSITLQGPFGGFIHYHNHFMNIGTWSLLRNRSGLSH